ncbi:MAG: DUF1269 domain-containing protein [Thermomicrobiales bacterium]
MSKSAQMLAAVYPDEEHAEVILDMLERMHHAGTISLVDAALVTKDDQGKVQIQETKELTARKGARRGAVIIGSMAILFPPTIVASALAGGVIGAISGKLHDSGIKSKQQRELADHLEQGKAIVVALAEDKSVAKVQSALKGFEGELIIAAIDEATMIEINKAAVFEAGLD